MLAGELVREHFLAHARLSYNIFWGYCYGFPLMYFIRLEVTDDVAVVEHVNLYLAQVA